MYAYGAVLYIVALCFGFGRGGVRCIRMTWCKEHGGPAEVVWCSEVVWCFEIRCRQGCLGVRLFLVPLACLVLA